jgi:hypothetical protein
MATWIPVWETPEVACADCGIEYWEGVPEENRRHRFGCPHWKPEAGIHQCVDLPEPGAPARLRYWNALGRWRLQTFPEESDGMAIYDDCDCEIEGYVSVTHCPFCGARLTAG